jgi:hypothetical protein
LAAYPETQSCCGRSRPSRNSLPHWTNRSSDWAPALPQCPITRTTVAMLLSTSPRRASQPPSTARFRRLDPPAPHSSHARGRRFETRRAHTGIPLLRLVVAADRFATRLAARGGRGLLLLDAPGGGWRSSRREESLRGVSGTGYPRRSRLCTPDRRHQGRPLSGDGRSMRRSCVGSGERGGAPCLRQ